MSKFVITRQNSTPKYFVRVSSHIVWTEDITKARRFPTERKAKDIINRFRLFRVDIIPYEPGDSKNKAG